MKTTIDLPDEVFPAAKMRAAEQRTTLRELMIQGLRQVLATPAAEQENQRRAALARILKTTSATNTIPMVPLRREELYGR